MNRDIKFRVWDNVLKKYGLDTEDAHLYQEEDFSNGIFKVCSYGKGSVAEQFTGLKDRNGKEIFEGDIVIESSTDTTAQVIWDDRYANFILAAGNALSFYLQGFGRFEVIGNIHENPELIK